MYVKLFKYIWNGDFFSYLKIKKIIKDKRIRLVIREIDFVLFCFVWGRGFGGGGFKNIYYMKIRIDYYILIGLMKFGILNYNNYLFLLVLVFF